MRSIGIVGKKTATIENVISCLKKNYSIYFYDPDQPLKLFYFSDKKLSVLDEPLGVFSPLPELVRSVDGFILLFKSKNIDSEKFDSIHDELKTSNYYFDRLYNSQISNYKSLPIFVQNDNM